MRLLITIPNLAQASGGPSISAVRTAESCAELGATVALAFVADARPANLPGPAVRQLAIRGNGAALLASLRGQVAAFSPDVIYDFGVWRTPNLASFLAARIAGIPWVCSPRGMLEPWALGSKSWKKRLGWLTYQRPVLRHAHALVSTSVQEQDNLRALLPDVPIWVVPNGVDLPQPGTAAAPRPRQALFLSRLDPKKQPDQLLRAWARARPADWRLVLAGPAAPAYREMLGGLVTSLGLQATVDLRDAVYAQEKDRLFRESDLFVLPTLSENFGIAIAEALSYGLPVITTTEVPWSEIAEHGCGWIVPPTQPALEMALAQACALPAGSLRTMGDRGRELAQRYSWSSAAQRLLTNFESLPRR